MVIPVQRITTELGGWIFILDGREDAGEVARRLTTVFAVPGVPDLSTSTRSFGRGLTLLQWSWGSPEPSDVSVSVSEDEGTVALVDGYVKEQGPFASHFPDSAGGSAVELLLEHADAAVSLFSGSFSCVRLVTGSREACAWTDRIASRSVWVATCAGTWLIGNYPAAIAAVMSRRPRLNPAGLWSLFLASRHIGRNGLFEGFENIQGGSRARIDYEAGRVQIERWRRNTFRPEFGRTPKEWGAEIAVELSASARRLQGTMSSPHLFLSGGLDSRLVLGVLGDSATGVTLTSTPNNMNVRIARRACRSVGAEHRVINRTPYWYLDRFDAAALLAGGNYNMAHAHFFAPVSMVRETDPSATFLLGDLMENFNKHYFKTSTESARQFNPGEIPRIYKHLYAYTHPDDRSLRRLFQTDVADYLEAAWKDELVALCTDVREASDDDRDCFDTLFRWHNCSLCPTYLMLESIRPLARERNVMFDNAMIDLLLRIPNDVRGTGALHPWTLWHLSKDLALLPDSNFWLPPITPKFVRSLTRGVRPFLGRLRRSMAPSQPLSGLGIKTEGSWHMLPTWYRQDARHRETVQSVLEDPACFPSDIFRREEIRSTWHRFLQGQTPRQAYYEVNMLLSFGLLHRMIPSEGLA